MNYLSGISKIIESSIMSKYYLKYSSIPNIPILGYIFYFFQKNVLSLQNNQKKKIYYMSTKKKFFMKDVLKHQFRDQDTIVCENIFFKDLLPFITGKIILDLSEKNPPFSLSTYEYYLFSLLYASKITKKTKRHLKNILESQELNLIFK